MEITDIMKDIEEWIKLFGIKIPGLYLIDLEKIILILIAVK